MADEVATGATSSAIESSAAPSSTGEAATSATPSSDAQAVNATPVAASESGSTPAAKPDFRAMFASDNDFKQFVEGLAGDKAQKIAKRLALKEKVAKATEDPVAALEVAQSLKAEYDEEDQISRGYQQVQEQVAGRLREYAADTDWRDEYESLLAANRKDWDKKYAEDPSKFPAFANAQVTKSLIAKAVAAEMKKSLPVVAEAQAISMTAKALQNVPELPTGNGVSGDLLANIANMDPETYRANREKILAAARARGWG